MKRLANCVVLFALFALLAPLASAATSNTWSYFPLPSKNQRTEVACTPGSPTFCTGSYANLPTVGYDSAISTFTGRVLDSTNVGDWQSYMRTLRAWQFKYDKVRKRFYVRMGSTLAIYDAANMVSRLSSGSGRTIASTANRPASASKGEAFLDWDRFFYAENPDTGWSCPYIDGQDRMPDLDFDDRGNVYLAYTIFGWGIVKDDFGVSANGGSILQSVRQMFGASDVTTSLIASVKTTDGKYYALVGAAGIGTAEIWEVTDAANPVRRGTANRQITGIAKADDGQHVAIFDAAAGQQIFVYVPNTLVTNGSPIFASTASGYKGITTDGSSFYSARTSGGALNVLIISPNGAGGYTETVVPTGVGMAAPQTVHFNDGYLTVVGSNDVEVFKVNGTQLTRLDLKAYASSTNLGGSTRFFNRYYAKCGQPPCSDSIPSGYIAPDITNFIDAMVFKVSGKTYILGNFRNLADVYELKSADGVTAVNRGISGSANPFSQQTTTGPFYGDKVIFGSSTTAPAPFNVNWNFGNTESPADNTVSSTTGTDVVHQYSGVIAASGLSGARTVTVTSATDSTITDSITLSLSVPTARIGVRGTNMLFLQPNVSSPAAIVTSDEFTDASDGTVDGHFASWTVDTTTTKAIPNATIAVGNCGVHTLAFTGNYGPYTGSGSTLTSTNGALPVTLTGIGYTVRPFVPVINAPTSNAANITFTSGSRATADTAVLPPSTQFTYQWDLLNSGGSSLQTATGTATLAGIPSFVVPKSSFTGLTGAKVRLQLSMASTALPAACQNYASGQAATGPLSAPDPKITGISGCAHVGDPCSMTVTSPSGQDLSSWAFSWSSSPTGIGTSSTKDFSPSFSASGNYNIRVDATNAIGSGFDSTAVNVQPKICANAPTQGDIAVSYFAGSTCAPGATCSTSDNITFRATTFTYAWNTTCDQYLWTFGDNSTSTSFSPQHKYAANGTYNGSFKLTVNGAVLTWPFQVVVGQTQQCNTCGCPGVSCGGCPTLTNTAVFISYFANGSQCSSNNTTPRPCNTGEAVQFTANPDTFAGYNFACTPHTFTWNFGDNQSGSGQQLTHVYQNSGNYVATLNVTASTGSASVQVPVTVTGTGTNGNCTVAPSSSNMAITFSGPSCSNAQNTCNAGENLSFSATPLAGYDTSCGTHTYAWDFGDGSGTVTGQSASHSFGSSQSQYSVKVTVTNNAGSATITQIVKINGGGPGCPLPTTSNLFLTYNAPSGCSYANTNQPCSKGETVNFGVSVNAFTGGGYSFTCGTHSFHWDFDDGTTSEQQNPTHAFNPTTVPRTYNVKCTITNPKGSVTIPIPLTAAGGTSSAVVDFTYAPFGGIPTLIQFTPSVTPPNAATSWKWTWGDGTADVTLSGAPSPQLHPYAASGTYTVTLTTNAGVVTKQVLVNVAPAPPRNRPSRH